MISDDVGQIWPILNCIVLTYDLDTPVYTGWFKIWLRTPQPMHLPNGVFGEIANLFEGYRFRFTGLGSLSLVSKRDPKNCHRKRPHLYALLGTTHLLISPLDNTFCRLDT